MKLTMSLKVLLAVITPLLFALPAVSQSQSLNDPNPGVVLTPNSAPDGLTYGEWSAKWFKWAYEPPPASNPVLDTTGANCAVGQSGDVWFLAGTFFPPGPPAVVRNCTIPAGQKLFFPVGNGFCAGDNFPKGFADERKCATKNAKTLSGFSAELDGLSIHGLHSELEANYYRALSPSYDLVLGADNIFGAPAGTYSPGAGDGVYLMLVPLTPGPHSLHFHADITGGGQIDATYNLTVGG